jgi:hypothetical protein
MIILYYLHDFSVNLIKTLKIMLKKLPERDSRRPDKKIIECRSIQYEEAMRLKKEELLKLTFRRIFQ